MVLPTIIKHDYVVKPELSKDYIRHTAYKPWHKAVLIGYDWWAPPRWIRPTDHTIVDTWANGGDGYNVMGAFRVGASVEATAKAVCTVGFTECLILLDRFKMDAAGTGLQVWPIFYHTVSATPDSDQEFALGARDGDLINILAKTGDLDPGRILGLGPMSDAPAGQSYSITPIPVAADYMRVAWAFGAASAEVDFIDNIIVYLR